MPSSPRCPFNARCDAVAMDAIVFTGKACFSPHVPEAIQVAWIAYGGTVCALRECISQQHILYFCYGRTDPWFPCLSENVVAVFHAHWIIKALEANFAVPIEPFLLNTDHTIHSDLDYTLCRSFDSPSFLADDSHLKLGLATASARYSELAKRRSTTPALQFAPSSGSPPPISSLPGKLSLESHISHSRARSPHKLRSGDRLLGAVPSFHFNEPSDAPVQNLTHVYSTSPDSSGDTLVEVPFIDLLKIPRVRRRSSTKFRYTPLQVLPRNRIHPTLPFEPTKGKDDTPRISVKAALSALAHIETDKACFIKHGRTHLDKQISVRVLKSIARGGPAVKSQR
ncbi:hypothetical protein BDW22DRAFT_1422235 [Trametopsis cervina]|nr:hypothetical protein BDW22DRAFT_1422235 [Trametopsis cervina]